MRDSGLYAEAVADAANVGDGDCGVGSQAFSKACDVDVETTGCEVVVAMPEVFENDGVGDGFSYAGREQEQ